MAIKVNRKCKVDVSTCVSVKVVRLQTTNGPFWNNCSPELFALDTKAIQFREIVLSERKECKENDAFSNFYPKRGLFYHRMNLERSCSGAFLYKSLKFFTFSICPKIFRLWFIG